MFDAGRDSGDNFAYLASAGLHYMGSVPASGCPDLTSLPASVRAVVDKDRFGALTACDARREVYGADRRAILTHSPELHQAQARGFDGTAMARPAGSWTSWPPPSPAARPPGQGTRWKLRSPRSAASPGYAG